ncbi:hypothetical protein TNCV_270661 [Trichonephila clavipes]|nr:hypothetical protein TNCV_270661 [Trichonephila clavipes]
MANVDFLHHENPPTRAGVEPATFGAEDQRQTNHATQPACTVYTGKRRVMMGGIAGGMEENVARDVLSCILRKTGNFGVNWLHLMTVVLYGPRPITIHHRYSFSQKAVVGPAGLC